MVKRVFLAIGISELRDVVADFAVRHPFPVRWIAAENLHVTLIPPWNEDDVDKIKEKLRALKDHEQFSISFNIVTYGPPKNPRLIWATGEMTNELRKLHERAAHILGIHERFSLHATLARFPPARFAQLPGLHEQVQWTLKVKSIVLLESSLLQGARYEVIEEIIFR